MAQPDVEQLLKRYRLPDAPASLDQRILTAAGNRLLLIRMRLALSAAAVWLLDLPGLGYVGWVIAWLSGYRTEYHITIAL